MGRLSRLAVVVVLTSCSRFGGDASSSAASSDAAPPPSAGPVEAAAANDGTDPKSPVLAPDDATFDDKQKGAGWSNRCFAEIKEGKWGWAHAACDRGLALPQVDTKAKATLLYNEGLIAKHASDLPGARRYFTESLALRPADDPGRAEVLKELASVGGGPTPPPAPKPSGGPAPASTCAKGLIDACGLCSKPCEKDSDCKDVGGTCQPLVCNHEFNGNGCVK